MHNFKLKSVPPSLSVSPHVDLIKFGTTCTSHADKYFGCGECELNIPDKREHTSMLAKRLVINMNMIGRNG